MDDMQQKIVLAKFMITQIVNCKLKLTVNVCIKLWRQMYVSQFFGWYDKLTNCFENIQCLDVLTIVTSGDMFGGYVLMYDKLSQNVLVAIWDSSWSTATSSMKWRLKPILGFVGVAGHKL